MDVLLVIDVQQGLFDHPRHEDTQVFSNINRLTDGVRQGGGRVIYVQHDEPGGELHPGSPAWQIHAALSPRPTDSRVRKAACDSFLDTELGFLLAEQSVDRLILCGCATDFCVDTTVRSAASHGFDVTVAQDAHTTADRAHLKADAIIKHHNWMWENLALPGDRLVLVQPTEQII